jgi:hypothetical protein
VSNASAPVKLYAFDVDETLELSGGPVRLADVVRLRKDGHIVGLCGNWAVVTRSWPEWFEFFSFVGPMLMTKPEFLKQLSTYVPAEEYVMVGNILGVSGQSDDQGAANAAGWRFIKESDFARGTR